MKPKQFKFPFSLVGIFPIYLEYPAGDLIVTYPPVGAADVAPGQKIPRATAAHLLQEYAVTDVFIFVSKDDQISGRDAFGGALFCAEKLARRKKGNH